jgi:uncharacterized membrane protein YdjX (TVP38/TMEM64 family)
LGLLIAAVAAAIGLVATGAYDELSAGAMRSWLQNSGPWGPTVFLVAFAVLQPLGLAAHVFILGATLVWSPGPALLLSWLGTVAAGCTAFAFARFVGHDWIQSRLPLRIRGYDDALAKRGFRTVLALRLLFFTFGPMQFMLGVSRVRFLPFVTASALGVLPLIVLEVIVGGNLAAWLFG